MKKINFVFAFVLLNIFVCSHVYAIDDVPYFNDCDFIPSNAYSVQNNSSHKDGDSFRYITPLDKEVVSVSNSYKIGNSFYRANKLRNVYFDKTYGTSIMFDFYSTKDEWKSPLLNDNVIKSYGLKWDTTGTYRAVLILGSTQGSKFDFRPVGDAKMSLVGPTSGSNNTYAPGSYSSKHVKHEVYYTKNENMTISYLQYYFTINSKNVGNNEIIFNIVNDLFVTEDIYILGFSIEGFKNIDTEQKESYYDISLEDFHNMRKSVQSECYVGSLPEDIASPDEEIECNGVIDCTIKEIGSSINKWLDSLLDFFTKLFIPDAETMTNLGTDFMDWFDKKLGFLAQPITFTINFLNRFLSLNDTGHYLIHVPNIKVPLFDATIINGFDYDLASALENENVKRMHDVTFVIINGTIGIAFLMLCAKKYDDVFGSNHNEPTETLIETEGYRVNDKTGEVVRNSHTFTKKKITRKRGSSE